MSRQTHSVKWILLVLFLSIALPWGLWCQERVLSPVEWTVLPKEVYVGDQVELRCVIAPGFELLPGMWTLSPGAFWRMKFGEPRMWVPARS